MPLIKGKSDKAFSKNVETEMDAGKPQKQSLAIAYAVKRKAEKDKMAKGGEMCMAHGKMACAMCHGGKMMADGGEAGDDDGDGGGDSSSSSSGSGPALGGDSEAVGNALTKATKSIIGAGLAEGGEVHEEGDEPYNKEEMQSGYADALAEKIMKQMSKGGMMYSEGGQVANDVGDGASADLEENQFDDLVKSGGLSSHIESNQEHGDAQESQDREDIIKKIMSSLAKKDRMPRPA